MFCRCIRKSRLIDFSRSIQINQIGNCCFWLLCSSKPTDWSTFGRCPLQWLPIQCKAYRMADKCNKWTLPTDNSFTCHLVIDHILGIRFGPTSVMQRIFFEYLFGVTFQYVSFVVSQCEQALMLYSEGGCIKFIGQTVQIHLTHGQFHLHPFVECVCVFVDHSNVTLNNMAFPQNWQHYLLHTTNADACMVFVHPNDCFHIATIWVNELLVLDRWYCLWLMRLLHPTAIDLYWHIPPWYESSKLAYSSNTKIRINGFCRLNSFVCLTVFVYFPKTKLFCMPGGYFWYLPWPAVDLILNYHTN